MTNISSALTRLFQEGLLTDQKGMVFKPGQILNGKILKLYPNGIASLQIGSQKITAQLEASIEAYQNYWLQVMPNVGKIRLKVLGPSLEQPGKEMDPITGLLKSLSIPVNEENKDMLRFYLRERLPVNKHSFQENLEWLKEFGSAPVSFAAIKLMEDKQLPHLRTVFQAVLEVLKNDSLSEQITTLKTLLNQYVLSNKGDDLAHFLHAIMKTKINTEGQLIDIKNDLYKGEELKLLLLEYLKEDLPASIKELSEKILYKISGLQLLSKDSGPIQQLIAQIPLSLWSKPVDLTVHWSGKKKENGLIDSDFCRILFYLKLENLKEIIVDMQIQNRIISIKVTNENEQLKHMAPLFIEQLKEKLKSFDYYLSSVQFIQPTKGGLLKEKQRLSQNLGSGYTIGVDLRI